MKNDKFTFAIIAVIVGLALSGCSPKIHKTSEARIEIPFEITAGNNIIFKTILNGTDTLNLYFDTGGTEIVLLHESIKTRSSLLENKNKDYKEENYVPLEGFNTLSIGPFQWDSLTIYPVTLGPKGTDGHFGWDLFENKIVELDYEKNLMIIHPTLTANLKGYSKLEIEEVNTLICVKGELNINGQSIDNRYLFDTGFQRAIVLDKDLRKEANFPDDLPVIKESTLRNGEGRKFVNQIVAIDQICFGESCADNIPVQLIATDNPARFKVHILGNELLKRFNTIFDFPNKVVYLKPNTLMSLPYADATK